MSSYGSKFKGLDLFVKIPTDLTEATTHGFILSISAVVFMVTLFFVEFSAFLTVDLSTKVAMDMNMGSQLRVNFNITIHDLHCAFEMCSSVLRERGRCAVAARPPRPVRGGVAGRTIEAVRPPPSGRARGWGAAGRWRAAAS
jgi:hypothetical protein